MNGRSEIRFRRVAVLLVTLLKIPGGTAGVALLTVSSLIAAWFSLFGGFTFYSDGVHWFKNARAMLSFEISTFSFTNGYPFLIVLTGFTQTGSIVPLLIVQTIFAALTPWLAFKTFARFDRGAGIAAGVVCLVSLAPFFFQNFLYHDEPSLFFGFVSLAFASAFFASRRPMFIYFCIASAAWAYFAQPGVIGFLVGCAAAFALFSLFNRQVIKHVIAALALLSVTYVGSLALQEWKMGRPPDQGLGARLFLNTYLEGGALAKFEGRFADQLRADLIRLFGTNASVNFRSYVKGRFLISGGSERDYQELYLSYEGRPADLVDRMFTQPNRLYYETIFDLQDGFYLRNGSNDVPDSALFSATLEFWYRHPLTVAYFVFSNMIDLSVGDAWRCAGPNVYPSCKQRQGSRFWPTYQEVMLPPGVLSDKASALLSSRRPSGGMVATAAEAIWKVVYDDLRPALLAAMFLGLLTSFAGPPGLRWTYSAIIGSYAINMAIFALCVGPEFRYQLSGLSLTTFAAGPGLYAAVCFASRAIRATVLRGRRLADA
jgi:hypothetical protein